MEKSFAAVVNPSQPVMETWLFASSTVIVGIDINIPDPSLYDGAISEVAGIEVGNLMISLQLGSTGIEIEIVKRRGWISPTYEVP